MRTEPAIHAPRRRPRRGSGAAPALAAVAIGALALAAAPFLLATTSPDSLRKAIAAQRSLLETRPTDGSAWSDLGNLLALDGDRAAAEEAYREALRLAPDLFDVHYNLGVLLLGEERFDAALKHLRRAETIDPSSAWTRYHIGSCLRGQGRRDDAIASFAEALRLDPRLAFPDVNPDVIANPLMTQSLLRAHRSQTVRDGAPRVYAEPNRIASLLVPPRPPVVRPGEAPAADEAAEAAAPPGGAAGPATIVTPAETGDTSAAPTPERGGDGSETDARQLRLTPPPDQEPGVVQVPATVIVPVPEPRRRVGPGDLSGGGAVEGEPAPRETPASPVTRFRPGRRSSAQLDLQLRPRGARDPRHASDASGLAASR
jgi:Flp pilus assembly protein TadD